MFHTENSLQLVTDKNKFLHQINIFYCALCHFNQVIPYSKERFHLIHCEFLCRILNNKDTRNLLTFLIGQTDLD